MWHLGNTDAAGLLPDATAKRNDGAPVATVATNGVADGARYFDGTSGYVNCGAGASLQLSTFTVEAWVNTTDAGAWYRNIVGNYGLGGGTHFWGLGWVSGSGTPLGFVVTVNGASTVVGGPTTLKDGQWHHLVGIANKGALQLYVDGAYYAGGTRAGNPSSLGTPVFIGRHATTYSQGTYDEIRISSVPRASNWIWACWANLTPGSAFASNGAVVRGVPEGSPMINVTNGATGVRASRAWLQATLTDTGTSATAVWSYWGPANGGTNPDAWAHTNFFGTNAAACPVAYSNEVAGLSADTAYYYAFRAANAGGTNWSAVRRFTTIGVPAVDNAGGATRILDVQAQLNGALTHGAEANVTIYWGASDGGMDAAAWTRTNDLGLLSEGAFASLATGLTNGVTYYYRCYAANEVGEAWAPASTNFVARSVAGPGQRWDGGGGANDDWTLGANWVGGVMPGRPATSVVTFDNTDVGNTNRLDVDWTLNGGLTVANTIVGTKHTTDLGGHTLTLNGGTLKVSSGVLYNWNSGDANIMFTNGTLKIGEASPADILIASGDPGFGTLTIDCAFSANLNSVWVCQGVWNRVRDARGVLDLRGSTPLQGTFRSVSLSIGRPTNFSAGPGTVYLNDAGGVITNVWVKDLYFCNGTLVLNEGAALTVGNSASDRGNLTVGSMGQGYFSATLAPTGDFSAYLNTVVVAGNELNGASEGTLDLRNARPTQSAFSAAALTIGGQPSNNSTVDPPQDGTPGSTGHVYLNDTNGLLTAVELGSLIFRRGTLELNAGADVSIGSSGTRGILSIGENGLATFAPSGDFSAYLTSLGVGAQAAVADNAAAATTGTLALARANLVALDVSGTATIGTVTGTGQGIVSLGPGTANFANLVLAAGPGAAGSVLTLRGTALTVGNSNTSSFSIGSGWGASSWIPARRTRNCASTATGRRADRRPTCRRIWPTAGSPRAAAKSWRCGTSHPTALWEGGNGRRAGC